MLFQRSMEHLLFLVMATFLLRRATVGDISALVELEFSAFNGDRISQRSWRDLLISPSAIIIAAVDGARLLGVCVLLLNVRTSVARIYSIAVAPEVRRQGIARSLIESAVTRAAENGASWVRLETRLDNWPAQRLFEHLGFDAFGSLPEHYEDGADAIRYQRSVLGHRSAPANFSR